MRRKRLFWLSQKTLHLDPALVQQRLQAKVCLTQTRYKFSPQLALIHVPLGLQHAQYFQMGVKVDGCRIPILWQSQGT
jgi:hypothetical protein